MKPLISYYGGKQRIATKIVEVIKTIPHSVYVEPFCGGAAVFFAKPKPVVTNSQDYRECLNDTSDLLINLYRTAKLYPEEFYRQIDASLYSQSLHRQSKDILKDPTASDMEKAVNYYINIMQSFSDTLNGGWGTSRKSRNHSATYHTHKTRLPEILKRLDVVYISCEDALRCIDRWDSKNTLFYCDPPYPSSDQGHYHGYSLGDYTALCEKLSSIKGSFILSNYNQPVTPIYDELIAVDAVMSSAHGKHREQLETKRTELLYIKRGKQFNVYDLPLFAGL